MSQFSSCGPHLARPFPPCGFCLQPDSLDFSHGGWIPGVTVDTPRHLRALSANIPECHFCHILWAQPIPELDSKAGERDSVSGWESSTLTLLLKKKKKKVQLGKGGTFKLCILFFQFPLLYCGKTYVIKFTTLTIFNSSVELSIFTCCAAITIIHPQILFFFFFFPNLRKLKLLQ